MLLCPRDFGTHCMWRGRLCETRSINSSMKNFIPLFKRLRLLPVLLVAGLTGTSQAAVTPVSYWRMGEHNPAAVIGGTAATADLVGGRTMTLLNSPFYASDVSATATQRVGSVLSLLFFANTYGTNALIPGLTNNFGLELWVKPSATNATQCIAYNGNSGGSGWGLYLAGGQYRGLYGGVGFIGGAVAAPGLWTHLALVRDAGVTTLYVNGVAAGATSASTPNPPGGLFAVGAQPQNPANERFTTSGYVDELRVFTFAPGGFSTNDLLLRPGGVFSTNDSGTGSLRAAITDLNTLGGGSLNFVATGVIPLLSSLPALSNSVAMNGLGTNLVTLSGNGSNRLFQLPAGSTNVITGLTLASGFTSNNNSGAAIFNRGDTVLQNCALVSNAVVGGFGGAVANFGAGSLRVTNCLFTGNTVRGGRGVNSPGYGGGGGGGAGLGGAVYTEGAALVLSGCTFMGNGASGGNGGNGSSATSSVDGGGGGFPNPGAAGGSLENGSPGGFGGGGGGGGLIGYGGTGGFGGGGGGEPFGNSSGPGNGGSYGGRGGGNDIFTTTGGGGGGAGLGGALFARSGTVAVVASAFTSNVATNGVGGSSGGSPAVNGQGVGGAVFVLDAALSQSGNAFTGNTASTAQPNLGGPTTVTVTNDSGAGSLRQAVLIANNAGSAATITFAPALSGQTITLTSGEITLTNSMTITATNLPAGVTISGGGTSRIFYLDKDADVTMNNLTLTGGNAVGANSGEGGAIRLNMNNSLTMNRCTLTGNSAGSGGAIYFSQGLLLNQCTLTGNSATASGGAINSAYLNLVLVQCTITGNSASQGGGIYHGFVGDTYATNSIIAGNTAPFSVNYGGDVFGQNNLIAGNPLLAPLGNYGGPTRTMPPLVGSPAIDGGANSVTNSFTTDQRGKPRLLGAQVDIGAVEGGFDTNYPLVNVTQLVSGAMQFAFTNLSGPTYNILATTNVALPVANWQNLGAPVESPSGVFTFTDAQAPNFPRRFYRAVKP